MPQSKDGSFYSRVPLKERKYVAKSYHATLESDGFKLHEMNQLEDGKWIGGDETHFKFFEELEKAIPAGFARDHSQKSKSLNDPIAWWKQI